MEPEMKAKIEALLKADNDDELNPAELATVSGGGDPTVNVFGMEMSQAEFNKLMMDTVNEVGGDAALEFFTKVTGQKTGTWHSVLPQTPMSDSDYMQNELKEYWKRKAAGN